MSPDDPRLERGDLPGATGGHARGQRPPRDLRIRKRAFVYWLDDHHGDGIVGVVWKARWGEADALVAADPERF
jgi:hypothetical protein